MRREVLSLREVLEARLDAMDKAIVLLQTTQDRLPEAIRAAVHQLERLLEQRFVTADERFGAIQLQFRERDVRDERTAVSTQEAIKAALDAQREMWALQNASVAQGMTRIEAAGMKQNDTVVTLFQTSASAQSEKVDDLKQRLTLMEGRTAGITAATTTQRETFKEQREGGQYLLAVIGFVAGSLLGLIGLLVAMFKA